MRFWAVAAILLFTSFIAVAHADTPAISVETDKTATTKTAEAPKPVIAKIKNILIANPDENLSVTVEGKALPESHVMRNQDGAVFVRAEPIFAALGDDFEYDAQGNALIVRRSQDGVVMELSTETGIVKADGKAIGKLRIFGEITSEAITLTPNAIAVLAGAKPKHDAVTGVLHFELDARLRVASGFQLYVNDQLLTLTGPQAKSVGPVLLLPLLPIAKQLGHFVQVNGDSTIVTVRRAQDSASFELDLTTGLVKQGGRPIGISKDVTYIDATNLLLPVSALETLTGTHIKVEAGTDRVDITLDDRLTGSIAPLARVDDTAAGEPFTLERLSFHTGLDTTNEMSATFRMKKFNGRLRYEIPDIPQESSELKPSWLSLDYRHLEGAYGTIGDYSANLRELDGVGIRRVRGASLVKEGEKGRWALAVGAPVSGSQAISEDQNRMTFDGLAAGARYADSKGWEAGVSLKQDGLTDDQMVVLSAISGHLGRKQNAKTTWDVSADIGHFKGPARVKTTDIRLSGSGRHQVNTHVDIDVSASYNGAEFLRNDLSFEALSKALVDDDGSTDDDSDGTTTTISAEGQSLPDAREAGLDQLTLTASAQYSAGRDIGILKHPGIAVRAQKSQTGFKTGKGNGGEVSSFGVTASTAIADTGANVTVDYTQYNQSFDLDPSKNETGTALSVRGFQRIDTERFKGTVRAQYSETARNDEAAKTRFDVSLSTQAWNIEGPKQTHLSIAPSLSSTWTQGSNITRGGVIASAHSGDLFGAKNRASASLGVLQAFGGDLNRDPDTFFTASFARQLQINKNLALSFTYRNDLKGDQRFGLHLDGRYDFNEARKYKATEDGRGVLKGRAFLDNNRDGIKQEDEPGVGGAILRVRGGGKKLALRTDGAGYFTVQNIREGIHEVQIDNRSLPLGYALADNTLTRATIRENFITDMWLPVVQRGQIRGFAFVDKDKSGAYEKGETRLEGARLRLVSASDEAKEFETVSTSFGQYAFDDLPAGDYVLSIVKTNAAGSKPGESMTVSLEGKGALMAKASIGAQANPIRRGWVTIEDVPDADLVAKAEGVPPDDPPDKEMEQNPAQDGPAP
ncbi:MAG: SdrD B-like domain-containing protein [Robiginitomaculum sp.]